jgi:hypothetical protein
MSKTYGQLADGIKTFKDYESKLIPMIKSSLGVECNAPKMQKLLKKAYNKGLNLEDGLSFIILHT